LGTSVKIKITINEDEIIDYYQSMDGNIENWAPKLIVALSQSSPQKIRENRQVFKFFNACGNFNDEGQSYLCVIDSSSEKFSIKIYNYDKIIFDGNLDEFAKNYDNI